MKASRLISPILFAALAGLVSCAGPRSDSPASTGTAGSAAQKVTARHAITNEHMIFLIDLRAAARTFPATDLEEWRMEPGSLAIPESADFEKFDHVRIFLAANPARYEGYVVYGFYFYTRRQWDVAVAAYDRAVEIIRRDQVKDTVEYEPYYATSLVQLFLEQREQDRPAALRTFEKLAAFDWPFFERVPRAALAIGMAALDYKAAGDREAAGRLADRARALHLPDPIRKKLDEQLDQATK